jgi:eukaryotic-like serine/threonine-protein kinase
MPIFRRGRRAPAPPPATAWDPAATQPMPVAHQTVVEEYPPPAPPPPREPNIWPWLLALLALLLLGVGIGVGYALTRNDDNNAATTTTTSPPATTTVSVPDVVGRRADVAASDLVQVGLKPDLQRKLSKRPSGTVIAQDPAAAAKVATGSRVVLTVSRGVDTVSVPALTGLTLDEALQKLRAAGLQADATRVASKKPEGQIVGQIPGGSAELKKGATVKLQVSKGLERVEVPDVVGQSEVDAATALAKAGLEAAAKQVPSDQPDGTVVAQSPRAGEQAAKGTRVQINVSGGRTTTGGTTTSTTTTTTTSSNTVTVPDLVGSTFADARRQLRDLGLRADRKDVPSSEPYGNVVAQYPAPGSTAKKGGSIRVNVSVGR